MPPKSSSVVDIVKKFSLKMIGDKNYPYAEGTSVMKQLAVESAKQVGLDSSAVSLDKYDNNLPGAKFQIGNMRFWFVRKSALVKLIYEILPERGEKLITVEAWVMQMPEVKKDPGASTSTSKK